MCKTALVRDNRFFHILIVFFVFLLISMVVRAESDDSVVLSEEMLEIVENAPLKGEYPGEGAVILRNNIEADYTALPYGIKVSTVVKIFDRGGAEEFSTLKIDYNCSREEVEVLKAECIRFDDEGKPRRVVPAKSETILAVNGYESDLRSRVLSFEAGEGDIVNYTYIKRIKEPLINEGFSIKRFLRFFVPVEEMVFSVKVPENRSFSHKAFNIELLPDITETDGGVIYRWVLKEMSPLIKEKSLPYPDYFVPYIIVSTFNNWYEFCDWFNYSLNGPYGENEPELSEAVQEITLGKYGKLERIRALYNFVASEIEYISVHPWLDGFEHRPLLDVYRNRCGNSVDKAYLLIALLENIGVSAEPVLLNISGRLERDLAVPQDLNHMIVYLPEYYLYLDPSFDSVLFANLPYFAQGKSCLYPLKFYLSETPVAAANDNLELIKQKVVIATDFSAEIDLEWKSRAYYDMLKKILLRAYSTEEREVLLKQLLKQGFTFEEASSTRIEGIEGLEDYFTARFKMSITDYMKKMGQEEEVELADTDEEVFNAEAEETEIVGKDLSGQEEILAEEAEEKYYIKPFHYPLQIMEFFQVEERTNPLFLETPRMIKREVEIEIPSVYQVSWLPESREYDKGPGSLKVSYSEEDNRVRAALELVIDRAIITPDEYLLLRELVFNAAAVLEEEIIIQEADILENLDYFRSGNWPNF